MLTECNPASLQPRRLRLAEKCAVGQKRGLDAPLTRVGHQFHEVRAQQRLAAREQQTGNFERRQVADQRHAFGGGELSPIAARARVVEAVQTIQVAGAGHPPRNHGLGICRGEGQRRISRRKDLHLRPGLAGFGGGLHRQRTVELCDVQHHLPLNFLDCLLRVCLTTVPVLIMGAGDPGSSDFRYPQPPTGHLPGS